MTLHELYLLTDSVAYAEKGLKISQRLNYLSGISLSLMEIGRSNYFAGHEDVALRCLIKSVEIAEINNYNNVLESAYRYIGFIYRPHEPYKAKEYYLKSLAICDKMGDEYAASFALSALGNVYEGIYDPSGANNRKALEYYERSLKIREKFGSPSEIASSLNETSRTYDVLGMFQKATDLRKRGLDLAEKSNDAENTVFLCNLIGNDYANRLHDYKSGLQYQQRAFDLAIKTSRNFELLNDVSKSVAICYSKLGDAKSSNAYFMLSYGYNDSIRVEAKKYDYNLSSVKQGLEKELEKQKLLVKDAEILKGKAEADKLTALRNSLVGGLAFLLVFIALIFYAYRQKQKSNKDLEIAIASFARSEGNFKQIAETINDVFYLYDIKNKKYKYINKNCEDLLGLDQDYFYTGKSMKLIVHPEDLQLVVDANVKIDSGIPYEIEYRIIVKDKIKWVVEKSSPIFDEHGFLVRNSGLCSEITARKNAEEFLRKKNKDITDSIEYGSKIQNALLVPKEIIAKKIKDFFILLKPKEIVSGDFYFYTETRKGIIIAACDCTGHGVSAGFMSMIGNAFLHEIVTAKGITNPSEILNHLRQMIIESLNQNVSTTEGNDGIDIALLLIDNDFKTVEYAGAFNSLYLIRNNELKEIKADLFPIGINFTEKTKTFTNNVLEIQKDDCLYIFSDGYSDQFGGTEGKKFMKKPMQELLLSVNTKKMEEQEKLLTETFNHWRGANDQVDDVLVIGIRI